MKRFLVILSFFIISACGKSGDVDTTASTDSAGDSASASSASGYNKIDWQTMDADQDGYVSPEEMKNHYNNTGVYN